MNKAPIGQIGVGLIGSVIASRLCAASYRVVGYDPSFSQLDGVEMASSASEVFSKCEMIVLSLPDSEVVRSVMAEVESVLDAGPLIINTTTGDAESVYTQMIEATIGGSSALLADGEAVLFLGGDGGLIQRAQPILDALSSRCFHLGEVGMGARFKLVHNMAIGLNRAVVAETLQFADALGFVSNQVLEILLQSPAASAAMKAKGAKMVAADYEPPQARLAQHLKDVRLMLNAAKDVSAKTPLTKVHEELLERAEALGYGDADNAAVVEAYRERK